MPRKRRKKSKSLRSAVAAVMDFIEPLSFLIALIVQLIVMGISMSLLGYNLYIKIGFVSIGFVVVMFAVIAYMKGNRVLWFLFAVTSIFFSWSFALVGTEAQTAASVETITVENDIVLETIRTSLASARDELIKLNADYDEAFRDVTIDSVLADRQAVRDRIRQYETQELERIQLIQSGELSKEAQSRASEITADRIFTAMFRAAFSGDVSRTIQFFIFGFIFIGVELTIITAIKEREKQTEQPKREGNKPKENREEKEDAKKIVRQPIAYDVLVRYAEHRFKLHGDGSMPSHEEFPEGHGVPLAAYINISEEAERRGLIKVHNRKHYPADMLMKRDFLEEMK